MKAETIWNILAGIGVMAVVIGFTTLLMTIPTWFVFGGPWENEFQRCVERSYEQGDSNRMQHCIEIKHLQSVLEGKKPS